MDEMKLTKLVDMYAGECIDWIIENQYDYLLVKKDEKEELLEQITLLQEAIEGALRISDLWIPSHVDTEHQGEAEALHIMRSKFIEALSVTRSNHE